MKTSRVNVIGLVAVLTVAVLAQSGFVSAASNKPKSPNGCEAKLRFVNYRSDLLSTYKKLQDRQYLAQRHKWASRIKYAGQWVPEDARKARTALYEYDKLHQASDQELDKQIKASEIYKQKPLDCSDAKKADLEKALQDINGKDGKKVVGGNALISQNRSKEKEYFKEKFDKDSENMVTKLHRAKLKTPQPPYSTVFVLDPPSN